MRLNSDTKFEDIQRLIDNEQAFLQIEMKYCCQSSSSKM